MVLPSCSNAQGSSTSTFTGGASTGAAGIAVQRFVAPLGQDLWADRFHAFFPTSIPVRISNITSVEVSPATSHPVYATLDSRRLNTSAGVWVGSLLDPQGSARQLVAPGDYTFAASDAVPVGWMWHDSIGYLVSAPSTGGALRATLDTNATGAWGSIGQESAYGNATGPLLTIWQEFSSPADGALAEYITVPSVELASFIATLTSDSSAYGASFGESGLWSAAVPSGLPIGSLQQLALGIFASGVDLDVIAPTGSFPPVQVRCNGAGAALLVSLNSSSLSVAAASPSQVSWTGFVAVQNVTLVPSQGDWFACLKNGTVVMSSPPSNGSTAVMVCQTTPIFR